MLPPVMTTTTLLPGVAAATLLWYNAANAAAPENIRYKLIYFAFRCTKKVSKHKRNIFTSILRKPKELKESTDPF